MAMTPSKYSLSALSVEVGLDRRTVAKYAAEIQPVDEDGRSKFYLMRDFVRSVPAGVLGNGDGPGEDDKLDPSIESARLNRARAIKAEMENDLLSGKTVDLEVSAAAYQERLTVMKARLMQLPAKIANQCVGLGHGEIEEMAREIVWSALGELADGTA